MLFRAQILVEFFHLLSETFIDLASKMVQALSNKYTSALGSSLGFSNKKNFGVIQTLLKCHGAAFYFLLSKLTLLLPIILYVMEIAWV